MTTAERKAALVRVRALSHDVRRLAAFDGCSTPPDWRPFVAELADEIARLLEQPTRRKQRAR